LAGTASTSAVGSTSDRGIAASIPVTPLHHQLVASSHATIVKNWLALWNGDLGQAKSIIAPDFALHASLLDGRPDTAIRGPDGLAAWVAQSHGLFKNLHFTVQVGPIVDGDFVVLRWVAEGNYGGGIPGAGSPVGTALKFTGTDILRIEGEKVKDYWLNADTGSLLMQLKVGQASASPIN
jgi:predicted ester cyclase